MLKKTVNASAIIVMMLSFDLAIANGFRLNTSESKNTNWQLVDQKLNFVFEFRYNCFYRQYVYVNERVVGYRTGHGSGGVKNGCPKEPSWINPGTIPL